MNNSRATAQNQSKDTQSKIQKKIEELVTENIKLREENKELRKEFRANNFSSLYLEGARRVIDLLSREEIHETIDRLEKIKKIGGRLFLLGVGGSAANCSHAVNDFRKIANIETYTVVDNVSELTARINDEGWDTAFAKWLEGSKLSKKDGVMIFSVGGGDVNRMVSVNIVRAIDYAKSVGATIMGIISRDGGYTREAADVSILVPVISDETITPFAESFQGLLWHLMVNHPKLKG
jgi:D-sedoheptulose 7-phosphate isomerase